MGLINYSIADLVGLRNFCISKLQSIRTFDEKYRLMYLLLDNELDRRIDGHTGFIEMEMVEEIFVAKPLQI